MIIMSVDLGKARTGIAVSDKGEGFAFPKTVINEYNNSIFAHVYSSTKYPTNRMLQ